MIFKPGTVDKRDQKRNPKLPRLSRPFPGQLRNVEGPEANSGEEIESGHPSSNAILPHGVAKRGRGAEAIIGRGNKRVVSGPYYPLFLISQRVQEQSEP